MILPLAKQTKRYDKLGFAQVRLGICQRDDDLIQKGLQLLELTEETTLLENLKEEVKQHRTSLSLMFHVELQHLKGDREANDLQRICIF